MIKLIIMEIKRLDNYTEIFFGNQYFIFDPPNLKIGPPIILTNPLLKVNKDKIFNSPGEFNLGDVYFFGFDDKNSISYLFQYDEGNLLYFNNKPSEETLKKLKLMKIELDAVFIGQEFKEIILSEFKPRIFITYKDINLPKFEKQKGNKFKIHLKKVNNLIFILQ